MKKLLALLLLIAWLPASSQGIVPEPINILYTVRVFEETNNKEHFITSVPNAQSYPPREPSEKASNSFIGNHIGYAEKLPNGSLVSRTMEIGTNVTAEPSITSDKNIAIKLIVIHTKLLGYKTNDGLKTPATDTMKIDQQIVLKNRETIKLESTETSQGNRLVLYVTAKIDAH